jgi:hypothetical protein
MQILGVRRLVEVEQRAQAAHNKDDAFEDIWEESK